MQREVRQGRGRGNTKLPTENSASQPYVGSTPQGQSKVIQVNYGATALSRKSVAGMDGPRLRSGPQRAPSGTEVGIPPERRLHSEEPQTKQQTGSGHPTPRRHSQLPRGRRPAGRPTH
eukprot:851891-Rhodomonas_salina.1